MKVCKTCGANIPSLASKCMHCNSFQNWMRHFHLSSTVLALLVALVSVIATAIPIIKNLFTEYNSDINIVYKNYNHANSGADTGKLLFIISNSGLRSGGVGDVFLTYSIDNLSISQKDNKVERQKKIEITSALKQHLKINDGDINLLHLTLHVEMSLIDEDGNKPKLVFLKPGKSSLLQLKPDGSDYASLHYKVGNELYRVKNNKFKYLFRGLELSGLFSEGNRSNDHVCAGVFTIINFSGDKREENIDVDCVDVIKIMYASFYS